MFLRNQSFRTQQLHQLLEKAEKLKASIRAKVEPPFRLIKQQFGYAKVRYGWLKKNTERLTMLCALGNLWMVRRKPSFWACWDECAWIVPNGAHDPRKCSKPD